MSYCICNLYCWHAVCGGKLFVKNNETAKEFLTCLRSHRWKQRILKINESQAVCVRCYGCGKETPRQDTWCTLGVTLTLTTACHWCSLSLKCWGSSIFCYNKQGKLTGYWDFFHFANTLRRTTVRSLSICFFMFVLHNFFYFLIFSFFPSLSKVLESF